MSFTRHSVRRISFLETKQATEENTYLNYVQNGDVEGVNRLLKKVKKLDVNCSDILGRTALKIAMFNKDQAMLEQLLTLSHLSVEHLYGAVFYAIENNDKETLHLLLNCPAAINVSKYFPELYPNIILNNMTPIMLAAISGNLEITKMLLENGHYIKEPHDQNCRCSAQFCSMNQCLSKAQLQKNSYIALSSPTFLILTSTDPLLEAFMLSSKLKNIGKMTPEFQTEYNQMSERCSLFATSLLHQCKDSDEVQSILSEKTGFRNFCSVRFPRLYLAILLDQKSFVIHHHCQQVLRLLWTEGVPMWALNSTTSWMLYIALQFVLAPFIHVAFIVLRVKPIVNIMRIPVNRFIYTISFYILFLLMLLVSVFIDRGVIQMSLYVSIQLFIAYWIATYIFNIFLHAWTVGPTIFFKSWWSIYDIFMFSMFLTAHVIWLYAYTEQGYEKILNQKYEDLWNHLYMIAEGIYAIGIILAFCRVFRWFNLNPTLGPLGISLAFMIRDIIIFFIMFSVVFLAFSVGMNFIYRNYEGYNAWIATSNITGAAPNTFVTIGGTIRSLLWAMYALGDPDATKLKFINTNNANTKHSYEFTESLGESLWWFYHICTVVVLLNTLIAMLAETYIRVQYNAVPEWLFARSAQWLMYIEGSNLTLPPFTLIPCVGHIIAIFKVVKSVVKRGLFYNRVRWRHTWDVQSTPMEQPKYQKIIVKLIQRYLQNEEMKNQESVFYRPEFVHAAYEPPGRHPARYAQRSYLPISSKQTDS